jgi:hypothetical protein
MSPSGYIWTGAGCGALGVAFLSAAASNNDLQAAMSAAGSDPGSDTGLTLLGVVLLVAAVVLLLIGSVGAGVRSGRRDD